jgi:hypothetical protein
MRGEQVHGHASYSYFNLIMSQLLI